MILSRNNLSCVHISGFQDCIKFLLHLDKRDGFIPNLHPNSPHFLYLVYINSCLIEKLHGETNVRNDRSGQAEVKL